MLLAGSQAGTAADPQTLQTTAQPVGRDSWRATMARYYTLEGSIVLTPGPYSLQDHRHILAELRQPRTARQDWSPARIVASRLFNPMWPDYLKSLYRACLLAYASWLAFTDADLEAPTTGPAAGVYGPHGVYCAASVHMMEAWREMEKWAGPLFDSWDQQNPAWALEGED